MPMSTVATKERGSTSPKRRAKSSTGHSKPKVESKAEQKAATPGGDRRIGQGGHRLAAAFDTVSALPALAESRRRLLVATNGAAASGDELADTIEADAGLAIQVMRAANNGGGPHGRTRGVREAVDVLTVDRLRRIAEQVDTYDPFERPGSLSEQHERFRRHAVATRYAADRIAELARLTDRDELAVAALLHDVGRLVLAELHSAFSDMGERNATPDERIRRERRELGIDHALVGGVLVRRWALSPNVAAAIEGHHSPKASGHAAAIRLADLVVHYASGDPVTPASIVEAAAQLDLERDAVLPLSVSTIRTHLHNVYRKIGAVDRAQAVLIAHEHGWI